MFAFNICHTADTNYRSLAQTHNKWNEYREEKKTRRKRARLEQSLSASIHKTNESQCGFVLFSMLNKHTLFTHIYQDDKQ